MKKLILKHFLNNETRYYQMAKLILTTDRLCYINLSGLPTRQTNQNAGILLLSTKPMSAWHKRKSQYFNQRFFPKQTDFSKFTSKKIKHVQKL